nr:MAG TPA: hypothetical protein [Bacteriophage sp.]DAX11594.1 MAG TPA: hypothetical protein [Bacteriophage sp.]
MRERKLWETIKRKYTVHNATAGLRSGTENIQGI